MAVFVLRRTLWAGLVIWVVSLITFTLSHVVPADPAAFIAGLGATESQVASIRRELGLDQPLPVQYVTYLTGLTRLDLGTSIRTRRDVTTDLRHFLPATLELIVISFVVYLTLSAILGVVAALRPGGPLDLAIRIGAISGSAVPIFWLAIVLQLLFYTRLGWLPIGGRVGVHEDPPPFVTGFFTLDSLLAGDGQLLLSVLIHLVLPVTTVVLSLLAVGTRLIRTTILDELSKPYVRVAASKGLRQRQIVFRHVVKNALNPIITVTALQFAYLLAWTILVEAIFSWPGIGLYAYDSFQALDYSPIMALTLVVTVAFVLVNLATDLIYPLLDPRIAR